MRWLRSIDWTPILASALILVIGLWVISSLAGHQFQYQPHSSGPNTGPQETDPWWLSASFWESTATAAIALFAVLQYRAADQTAKRQLRAYVNVVEGGVTGIQPKITIRNFGATPAYRLTFWVDALLCDPDAIPEFKPENGTEIEAGVVVGPGAALHFKPGIRPNRSPTTNLITQPPGEIFAFGEIKYIDAFDKERSTKFCLFCKQTGGAFAARGPNNIST